MKAFGMIETKGLIAAIEGADVMSKTSNISLLEKIHIGAGLVTVTISGDVGAVRSAVDAGVSAINNLGENFLISSHVIARPHDDLNSIFILDNDISQKRNDDFSETDKLEEIQENVENKEELSLENEEKVALIPVENEERKKVNLTKEEIEKIIEDKKLDVLEETLKSLKISEIRKIVKEYKELGLTGKQIAKLPKEILIKKIFEYYGI